MSAAPSVGDAAVAVVDNKETIAMTLCEEPTQDQIESESLLSPIDQLVDLPSPTKLLEKRAAKAQRCREYRARLAQTTDYRAAERERKRLSRQRKKAEAEALLYFQDLQTSAPPRSHKIFRLNQKILAKKAMIAQRQREYRARQERTPYARAVERERKRLYRARKKAEAKAWAGLNIDDTQISATMVSSSDFDPSLTEDERRFYLKAYPNIEMVRDRKVHCTICKMHIGTAPSQESIIKMHPVLRVTHCTKCHDFYNSGEFSKGEDGSELYCRWCGQGGEVYCCSNCPFVFCKSCIVKNLSRGVVADIEQNENWSCFNCAPKILWPLRAQHWALIKYIEKQKKGLVLMNLPESEMKLQMATDRSTCCRLSKAKLGSMSDSLESVDSLSRRSREGSVSKKPYKSPSGHSPAAKRPKPNNDEVVCTPDLLSMLEPDCQITVSSKPRQSQSPMATSPKVMSIQNPNVYSGGTSMQSPMNKNPPPLVLRNTSVQVRPISSSPIVRRTVIGPRAPTPGGGNVPVYHTINGYRIDLNSAAQQETFRLPNGKLIQVKRQGSSQGANQTSPSTMPVSVQQPNAWQRQIQQSRPVQIAQLHSSSQQHYPQITIQQHSPQQHPQMLRYQNTLVGNTTVTMHNGSPAQIQVINGAPQQASVPTVAPTPQVAAAPAHTRPLMVRHVFPDTAIGQARAQLQDQVFNAMEICQHLTGKVQTLTNSNAYKQARNYLEVKELYIHLSYLLTYAIGRFKGLQDKCLGDMRQLGFVNDADSLENGQLAAGVDYVRYGQLDDVELFNTGCNSFHNQVYEYRKSLHANLENDQATGGDEPPLSPLRPLGTCFIDADDEKADSDDEQLQKPTVPKVEVPDVEDESQQSGNGQEDDIDDDNEVDDTMQLKHNVDGDDDEAESLFTPITSMYEDENAGEYTAGYDGMDNYEDDYDMTRPGGGRGEAVIRRENESHANDRKLTHLIEKYPSIWCTRHPDYGNFEITRKQWNRIASHFGNEENIKLRWKNIRKRFVRIEERLKIGKRFNGYYDRSINFLFNRSLPEHEWMPVDRGDHFGAGFGRQSPSAKNDYSTNEQFNNDFRDEADNIGGESNYRTCPVRVVNIKPTDMKIINFVKCNPVIWRKTADPTSNKMDERTRKSLWMHLWKQLPAMSCEELMDRWAHLYEMYKTFRLKHIKDENILANMEVKYSKYLATLHFLYKIDEEDLKKENLTMQDCGNLDELPENDLNLHDMPDDREFVFALVAAVKPCVNLWHHRHLDYNDTMRRNRMWQEIEEKLKDFKHKQASDDEDNEIEIVEPKTDTITLIDSDNEDDSSSKSPAKNTPHQTTGQINTTITTSSESTTPSNGASNENHTSLDIDFMATAQSFLASMLEVDFNEGDQPYTLPSPSGNGGFSDAASQKKQPRKKTTNKPNPTLLKQKEMLERERLEEMKRNDMKLKMKCTIELKKAEEEFPFAKSMLNEKEIADAENKKVEDCEEVEVLLVEDLDSSAEEEKLKLADDVGKRGNVGEMKEIKDGNMEEDSDEKENKIGKVEESDESEETAVADVDIEDGSSMVKEISETEKEIKTTDAHEEKIDGDVQRNDDEESKKVKENELKNDVERESPKNVSDEPTKINKNMDKVEEAKPQPSVCEQSLKSLSKKSLLEQNDKNGETTAITEKDGVDDIELIELNETEASTMNSENTIENKEENDKKKSLNTINVSKEEKQNVEMIEVAEGELKLSQKEDTTKIIVKEDIVESGEKIKSVSIKSEEDLIETQAQEDKVINNDENKEDETAVVTETAESINGEAEIDVDKEIEKLLQKERSENKCDDNISIEAATTSKSTALEKLESTAPTTEASSEDLMNDITELIENATNIMT